MDSFPAPFIVHTVSGPVFCCETHMQKLVGLQRFLGAHAHVETIADLGQCSNCENEAKEALRPQRRGQSVTKRYVQKREDKRPDRRPPAAAFMQLNFGSECVEGCAIPHRYALYVTDSKELESVHAPDGSLMARCPECGAWVWHKNHGTD